MTNNQIRWASQHDWFFSGDMHNGLVRVQDYDNDSVCFPTIKTFSDFTKLRQWAGY